MKGGGVGIDFLRGLSVVQTKELKKSKVGEKLGQSRPKTRTVWVFVITGGKKV